MKIYLVGGAVRDQLLGLPIKERDWVVVGASVDDMLALGYKQVGKEFPVFLHPKTGEEYALARMERKTKPGYKGFVFDASPEVTLSDDLSRRDLTINAMAQSVDGQLVDPYHGQKDLENKILRHVSPAFIEDPVRILRVGRFLARYAHQGFHVAPETIKLMRDMVQAGEVNALVAERVWKELERALTEKNPEKFFAVLNECGALAILFPELKMNSTGMQAMMVATKLSSQSAIRLAALLHDLPDAKPSIRHFGQRYRIPHYHQTLAELTAIYHAKVLQGKTLSAQELLDLFYALDIFRKKNRFDDFLTACQAIAEANGISFDTNWLNASALEAMSLKIEPLLNQGLDGQALANKIKDERRKKIADWLKMNV